MDQILDAQPKANTLPSPVRPLSADHGTDIDMTPAPETLVSESATATIEATPQVQRRYPLRNREPPKRLDLQCDAVQVNAEVVYCLDIHIYKKRERIVNISNVTDVP